jgi:internalin A
LVNLVELLLSGNTITDFSPLSSLINLENTDVGIPVEFPDTNLASTVRTALDLAENGTITAKKLADLITLDAQGDSISDLTGLEHATHLQTLDLDDNDVSDLTPLSGLAELTYLFLDDNAVSDLTLLSGFTGLTRLSLDNNGVSDLTPLSVLTGLIRLSFNGNDVSNLTPLSGLTGLTRLEFENNSVTDLSALSGLLNLVFLRFVGNDIEDTSLLGELPNVNLVIGRALEATLRRKAIWRVTSNYLSPSAPFTKEVLSHLTGLHLYANDGVKSLIGLEYAANLESIRFEYFSPVPDLSPLAGAPDLQTIIIAHCRSADLTTLKGPETLTRLQIKTYSKIPHRGSFRAGDSEIRAIAALTSLKRLELENNHVTDVTPLAALTELTHLNLKDGDISDVTSLSGLTNLRNLDLRRQ